MAIPTNAWATSTDGAALLATIREDLSDIITNIDPVDTPLFSMIGSESVQSTKHEWLTDTLASVSAAGRIEGEDFSAAALTDAVRIENYTHILRKDFQVTGTTEAVNNAGMGSQFAYQAEKAMRELARNTEAALIQSTATDADGVTGGTQALGDSDSARTMKGLSAFVPTSSPDHSDAAGGALSEAEFTALLESLWTAGAMPNTVLCSATAKKYISGFSGNTNILRHNTPDVHKVTQNVLAYESDFGTVDVVLERYPVSGESYVFDRNMLSKGYLRPTRMTRLAPNGDSERGMVLHELTLIVKHPSATGKWTGIS